MINPTGGANMGSYVPPAPGGMAPPPSGYPGASYPPDMYSGGGVPMGPGGPAPAPGAKQGPNLMMVGGLALGGFLLFGPIGAIIGAVVGLMMK